MAAVNKLGDALASGGGTYASDDDPELIKAATPFSLKLIESLLAESPRHCGLLLAAASGFTQYAYAFVQLEADELEERDLAAATALHQRAARLYLRARNYGLRALEVRHPGFENALRADAAAAVGVTNRDDTALLYWSAASWAGAISLSKTKPSLVAELPLVEALIDRALALDESFGAGAIHSFLITYEMVRAAGAGDAEARSRHHFDRAMQLAGGSQAAPLVALAEAVCIQRQAGAEFESLLRRALEVPVDAHPEVRLANLLTQRRARWLLARKADLFLNAEN